MAEKKLNLEVEIRKAIKAKKILFGKKQTEHALKLGNTELVVLANDCFYRKTIEDCAKLSNARVINFDGSSYKLGNACDRAHAINALAILK